MDSFHEQIFAGFNGVGWPADSGSLDFLNDYSVGATIEDQWPFSLPSPKASLEYGGLLATPPPDDTPFMPLDLSSPLSSASSSSPSMASTPSLPSSPSPLSLSTPLPTSSPRRSPRKKLTPKASTAKRTERKKTTRPSAKAEIVAPMKPKKGDAGYIPRPPNAFILFRKEFMKHRDPELLRQDQKGKSIVTGKAWKALSREDRAVWDSLAEEVKRAHAVMYPGYRYRPTPRTMPKMKRNTHQVPGIDNVYEAMADAITLAKDEDEVLRLGEKAKELRVAHVCNEGSSHGGFKTVFRSKPAGSSPAQTDAPALRNSPLPVVDILAYEAAHPALSQNKGSQGNWDASPATSTDAYTHAEVPLQGAILDAVPLELPASLPWMPEQEIQVHDPGFSAQVEWANGNVLDLCGVHQDGTSIMSAPPLADESVCFPGSYLDAPMCTQDVSQYSYSHVTPAFPAPGSGGSGHLQDSWCANNGGSFDNFDRLLLPPTPRQVITSDYRLGQVWQPETQVDHLEAEFMGIIDNAGDTLSFDDLMAELDQLSLATGTDEQYEYACF